MPKISVIIPVYKVEKYLTKCVDSVLVQSFTDFEVILVDDGSPDNCGKICDDYAAKDDRVKVIHKANGGLSDARNAGLTVAKAQYVSFIDSDDFVAPDYLEKLYNLREKFDADIAVTHFITFIDGEQIDYDNIKSEDEKRVIDYCLSGRDAVVKVIKYSDILSVTSWGKLFDKKMFNEVIFPVGKTQEDNFVTPINFYLADKVSIANYRTYFYFQREGSIMGSKFSGKEYHLVEADDFCMDFLKKRGESKLIKLFKKNKKMHIANLYIRAKYENCLDIVPAEYKMKESRAWRILKRNLSEKRYARFLATYRPDKLAIHERWIKIKKILHLPIK